MGLCRPGGDVKPSLLVRADLVDPHGVVIGQCPCPWLGWVDGVTRAPIVQGRDDHVGPDDLLVAVRDVGLDYFGLVYQDRESCRFVQAAAAVELREVNAAARGAIEHHEVRTRRSRAALRAGIAASFRGHRCRAFPRGRVLVIVVAVRIVVCYGARLGRVVRIGVHHWPNGSGSRTR